MMPRGTESCLVPRFVLHNLLAAPSLPSHCDGALLHGRGVGQLSDGRAKKRVRGSGKNNLSALPSSSSDDNLCRTVVASNEPKLQTKDGLFDFFNGGFEDGLFTANLFVSATSVVLYPCRVDRLYYITFHR